MSKTLKAGTKKYLLLDAKRIERNAERTKKGEPIVLVAEVDGDLITLHRGHTVTVRGADIELDYSQNTKLKIAHGIEAHAAFMTHGEVLLDAEEGEKPAAPKAPKAAKPAAAPKNQE